MLPPATNAKFWTIKMLQSLVCVCLSASAAPPRLAQAENGLSLSNTNHASNRKPLSATDIYRMGFPSAARFNAIGKEVLIDAPIWVHPGGVLAEIPVPDDVRWLPNTERIQAHLFDISGPIRGYTNRSRLRISGMIVDEGYGAYMIYVHSIPEVLPPLSVAEIAASIKTRLPEGWNIAVSNETIRIATKKDVPFASWRIPDESDAHYAKRPDFKGKYEYILKFAPRLSDDQFEKMRRDRKAFAEGLKAAGEDSVSVAEKVLVKRPLPRYYTESYSIYLDEPARGYMPSGGSIRVDHAAAYIRDQVFRLKFHEYQQEP